MSRFAPLLFRLAEETGEHGDEVHHAVEAGVTSGWAVENVWIMLLLPFVAAFLIVLFGRFDEKWGHRLAVTTTVYMFLHGSWIWYLNITQGVLYEKSIVIAEIGSNWVLEWGWVVDGLSSMMYFVVGTVSMLVFFYAVGYMKGEIRYAGFFAAFSLFAGAMLVLVAAPNLAQLIVGWELVGVASYLLIGHYWEDKANSSAGMKAFFTNKVADVGLIIGSIMLATAVGSFRISDILTAAEEHAHDLEAVAVVGAILLFFGAMGKSAQFPLHVWLPDAMAGPTPVSALMHAATMVTAGVYLLGRMFPLFEGLAGVEARQWVMWIGAATLLLTGLIALVQRDIKKVLAYSTLSQLGYMVTALGAGAYTAGLFHLFTHAFFKALLFLGAGSAIHAVHSNDMHDMGGLRKFMPRTYATFLVASLALAGIIPLAGYWSKDEILVGINAAEGLPASEFVLWVATVGAFITAFYMTRTVALTFFGQYKGHGHPHEAPAIMTWPLMILGVFSVGVGWVNIPGVYTGFTDWLAVRAHAIVEHHVEGANWIEATEWGVALPGLVAGVLGITIGVIVFGRDEGTQAERDRFRIPVLYPLLENQYYIDDFYLWLVGLIKGPLARAIDWTNSYVIDAVVNGVGVLMAGLGRIVYGGVDQRGIDFAFTAFAGAAGGSGGLLRRLQTGRVQQYAGAFVIGAVLLVIGFTLFR